MAPFQYVPWAAPDIPSIASLLAHQADPYARAAEATAAANAHAREVSGDVWGRAIQQIGQLPNQLIAQTRETADAAQKRALLGSEIQKNQQDVAARQQAVSNQKLLATLVQQHTGEDGTTDHEAVAHDYASQTGDTQRAQQYLKGYEDIATSATNLRKANQQRVGDYVTAIGKAANTASDYGEFMTRIDHLVVAKAITPEERQDILQQTQAGAQDWPALKAHLVKTADGYAPTKNLKDGETEYGGVSNQPVVSAPKKLTNEAELAADAATAGTPQETPTAANSAKALESLRLQKNPPSLEEQYLKAKATGDTDGAQRILTTLKETAAAKRDPAMTALATELGGLRVETAKARLDDLTKKSEPMDISPDVQTTRAGRSYIDLSGYTGEARNKAREAAGAAGAVGVSKEQANALQEIDNARFNQQSILDQIGDLLPKGPAGRAGAALTTPLAKVFQTDDQIAAYNTWRTAAIQTLRATAGSKGLRINEAEIKQAIENDIPKLTDTVSVAQQKVKNINTMLENAERSILVRDRSVASPPMGPATPATLTPGLTKLRDRP